MLRSYLVTYLHTYSYNRCSIRYLAVHVRGGAVHARVQRRGRASRVWKLLLVRQRFRVV